MVSRYLRASKGTCGSTLVKRMVDGKVIASGTGLKRAGFVLIVLGGLLYAAMGGVDSENPFVWLVAPLMIGGLLLHFRGRQQAARAVAESSGSPLRDSRPHVLYLRSFKTDPATPFKKLFSGFTTEEEQLADVLRPFGNLVAIGRPGEPLPLPGATRMYATESEWKELVLDRMRSAPLVVIRAGGGPGLAWEVAQAFSTLRPKQILVLVLNLALHDYRIFANLVRDHTQLALPAIDPCGPMWTVVDFRYNPTKALPGFLIFSDDWSPAFLPLPFTLSRFGYNDLKKAFNATLRPVFERHGVDWHPRGRFG
jgi:hypothetical protein